MQTRRVYSVRRLTCCLIYQRQEKRGSDRQCLAAGDATLALGHTGRGGGGGSGPGGRGGSEKDNSIHHAVMTSSKWLS